MHHQGQPNQHVPVLPEHVLYYLDPKEGDSYLDLTAGYGGHAEAILERTKRPDNAVLVDRDSNAIDVLRRLHTAKGAEIIHDDFLRASQNLAGQGRSFDLILADLGVSSPHMDDANRGFAFASEGPLDMRMDQRQMLTAEDIVNTYPEAGLADILRRYGEEPKAAKVARLIVQNRPFTTTTRLAQIVARAWPGHRRIHPATRTFQALRIAVNDELGQLEASLPLWISLLKPGGRIAVISFHSLEDRLVKAAFNEFTGGYDAAIKVLTKHPARASESELAFNPRARSAKLRAAAKIKK